MRKRPIGVFDSGIGGLTVFKALSRRMPEEDLIYFGDTAHVPYGSKSKETVTRYSLEVAGFLASLRIKALVVACNTSSALALDEVARRLKMPVLGVIKPGAQAAAAATRNGQVGIIGTEATIASGAYTAALRARLPRVRVRAVACPLFVPLVEAGWWGHRATVLVARHYLAGLQRAGIDTLILGCTHYPLLKGVIRRVVGPRVRLIDSAEQTAIETEKLLLRLGLRRGAGRGKRRFFVSDAPRRFLKLARRLLGVRVARVERHAFE
ncbi:MAG TPA: glutamate racemase [Elusimicrobia bacterium]|nr:glutamate racemase [Elusimicrobiota bacterium]HBT62062.1 glutamate racemase [Elusimicrobiota bacterium]